MTTQLPFVSSASTGNASPSWNRDRQSSVRCFALVSILGHAQQLPQDNGIVADGIIVLQSFRSKIDAVMTRDQCKTVKVGMQKTTHGPPETIRD